MTPHFCHKFVLTSLTSVSLAGSLFFLEPARAVTNSGITYHGRILNPDGTAVVDSNVQFKMQIRTPDNNNCLLYEEIQSKDLSSSSGAFSITLNDTTGTRTDTSGYLFDRIFANYGTFNVSATNCISGSGMVPYSPGTSDGRAFAVYFKTSSMAVWEPLPQQAINFAPFAIESKQVAGFPGNTLLRVENGSGPQAVSSFTPTQAAELFSLANGTSTKFIQNGANGAPLPSFATDPSSPVAGDFWYDSSGNVLKFYNGTSVQTLGAAGSGITSLTAGTGLTGGTITTSGTIALATSGVSAGTYSKVTVDTYGRVTTGANITGSDITSGTIGGSTAINTTGNISANAVSATTTSTQSIRLFEATNAHKITITAPASLSVDYGLVMPATVAAGNGYALTSDTSGNLSWSSIGVTGGGTGLSNGTSGGIPYFASSTTMASSAALTNHGLVVGGGAGAAPYTLSVGGSNTFLTGSAGADPTWTATSADAFSQYALLAGRSGGQILKGGTAASENLTLDSTSNATKGNILLAASGGNVGVGTTSPSAALDVFSAAAGSVTAAALRSNPGSTGGNSYNQLLLDNRYGAGNFKNAIGFASGGATKWQMGNDRTGAGLQDFYLWDSVASATRFLIDSSGNVGIGTSSPASTLDVNGTINGVLLNKSFTITNLSTPTWYKFASLPASTGSTYDQLKLDLVFGGWYSDKKSAISAVFGNRGSFQYQYQRTGDVASVNAWLKLVAYDTGSGVDLYIYHTGVSAYTTFTISIPHQQQETLFPNLPSQTSAPTGTLVFDSSSSSYPPTLYQSLAGNVGIGTASPAFPLDVNGVVQTNGKFMVSKSGTSSTANTWYLGGAGVDQKTWDVYQDVNTWNLRAINDAYSASNNAITINRGSGYTVSSILFPNGNVAIGTTAPATALDLNGAFSVRGMAAPSVSPAGQGRIYFDSTSNAFMVSQNGGAYATLATTGGSGGGQNSTSSLTFNSNSDGTGSDGGFTFQSNGSSLLSIANNGDSSFSSTTASTSSTTGAVKISGGLGVAGNINSGGTINAATSMTTPQIYGSSAASGTLSLDGTSNATKGNVLINVSGGNVGIGTNNPTNTLDVSGGIRTFLPNGAVQNFVYFNAGNGSAAGSTNINRLRFGGSDGNANYFSIQGVGNADYITINNGNVGVGTTTPSAPFEVATSNGTAGAYNAVLSRGIGDYSFALATKRGVTTNVNGDVTTQIGLSYGSGPFTENANIRFHRGSSTTGGFMSFTTNNDTERMRIDSSGFVGIGTSTVSAALHVYDTAGGGNTALLQRNHASCGATFEMANAALATDGWTLKNSTGACTGLGDLNFIEKGSNGNERMTLKAGGNVGIGTANPSYKLHVEGDGNASTAIISAVNATAGSTQTAMINVTSDASAGAIFATSSAYTDAVTFDPNPVPKALYIRSSTAATGGIQLLTGNGSGDIVFKPNAAEVMRVKVGGNVGIGTTVPASALDLNGALSVRGMAAPTASPAGQGRIYFDSTSNTFMVSQNGGAYATLATTGGSGGGQASTSSLTFNSNSDGSGSDGGFNFQANGSSLLTIANNGNTTISATTASTSNSSGALVVAGGLGVGGAINAAGNISTLGNLATYNATAATSGANANSNMVTLVGNYWNGTASAFDTWALQNVLGSGTNPTSTLVFSHPSGSTGTTQVGFTSGNVGIGTASPSAPLHIVKNNIDVKLLVGRDDNTVAENSIIRVNTAGASGYTAAIGLDSGGAATQGASIWANTGASGLRMKGRGTYSSLYSTTPDIMIDSSGNVGIGTSSPTYPLQVRTPNNVTTVASIHSQNTGAETAVPVQAYQKQATLQIVGGDNNENAPGSLALLSPSVGTGSTRGPELYFSSTRSTTAQLAASTYTASQSGDYLGAIYFGGDTGAALPLRTFGAVISAKASGNWSGTSTPADLVFSTTPSGTSAGGIGSVTTTEHMRLTSAGYLGIGTTSPLSTLHLSGAASGSSLNSLTLQNNANAAGTQAGINFIADGSYVGGNIALNRDVTAGPRHSLRFSVNGGPGTGANALTILDNGSVGIGTTSPNYTLDVAGSVNATSNFRALVSSAAQGFVATNGTNVVAKMTNNGTNDNGQLQLYNGGTNNILLLASGTSYLNGGNVGIGTSSPTFTLDVRAAGASLIRAVSTGANNARLAIDNAAGGNQSSILLNDAGVTKYEFGKGVGNYFFIHDSANSRDAFEISSGNVLLSPGGGNVGIGTGSPGQLLQVGGSGDGSVAIANAWNTFSDERLKNIESKIPNALAIVEQLNGYYFFWKDSPDKSRQVGVIAQEVEKVLPELVKTGSDGIRTVDYPKLAAVLIEASKTLSAQNRLLQEANEKLQKSNEALAAQGQKQDQEMALLKAWVCSKDPSAPVCH